MSYRVESHRVVFDTGETAELAYPIKCHVAVGEIVVVALAVPKSVTMTENVFGITKDAGIIWQIQPISETATNPVNTYTNLFIDGLKLVVAGNWNGTDVRVNVLNGRVIDTAITR